MARENPLKDLQYWYKTQCNGTWETLYGMTIQTTDVPGWRVEIDLDETILQDKDMTEIISGKEGDEDYLHCRKQNGQFLATCAPSQLEKVVTFFLDWAGGQKAQA